MAQTTLSRRAGLAAAALAALMLGGCAGMKALDSNVSSYSQWPADRKPSSYAFERLPSQQANPQQQDELEAAAREALAQAGFSEASDPKASDVTVQLGARETRYEQWPWGDPFGFYGGFGYYGRRHRGYWGPGFGMAYYAPSTSYDREVAVLIRDRKSGQPLYESHATNDGYASGGTPYLVAMFIAALKDFPQPALNPRRVSIPLAAN